MTQELHIERVFDAPRELVWKAFTDPDELSQWFGPVGYHVPRESVEVDLRVGGHQKLTMVPDSDEYPPAGESSGTIVELVENELLVTREDLEGEMAELFGTDQITMRLELHDEEGKTRLVVHQGPYRDDFVGNAKAGWESSFTKLDTLLAR
jgi:uncharacterized protein YndB with AHSA1/START domain